MKISLMLLLTDICNRWSGQHGVRNNCSFLAEVQVPVVRSESGTWFLDGRSPKLVVCGEQKAVFFKKLEVSSSVSPNRT